MGNDRAYSTPHRASGLKSSLPQPDTFIAGSDYGRDMLAVVKVLAPQALRKIQFIKARVLVGQPRRSFPSSALPASRQSRTGSCCRRRKGNNLELEIPTPYSR